MRKRERSSPWWRPWTEFCPRVEVVRPGMCAIGARGPARYFGGEGALAEKITQALAGRGVACRTGIADGMFAAQLAARTGRDGVVVPPGGARRFLAPHPVGLLEDPELTGLLVRLGIHTLDDFAALPARDVLARFGVMGAIAHRLARGLEPRPLAPRAPSADLSAEMEFDPPMLQAEPVVFAGKALADRLFKSLAGRGLSCVRIEVQVGFTGGQTLLAIVAARRAAVLAGGGGTGALAARRMAYRRAHGGGAHRRCAPGRGERCAPGRGERCAPGRGQSGARPAGEHRGGAVDEGSAGQPPADDADDEVSRGGITVLRLVPDQIVPDEGTQLGLWGEALVSDRVARAAARVQSLLGHEAVTRPVLAGGRGPGDQVTLVPFGDSRTPRLPADRPWPGRIPAPSPITVFPAPLPASVTCASGEPVTVTGRAAISAPPARLAIDGGPLREITAWAGPWPVQRTVVGSGVCPATGQVPAGHPGWCRMAGGR